MKKNCELCNKLFEKPVNNSKKRWEARKYCSCKCSAIGCPNKGKLNGRWKGINVGYQALHKWVIYHKGKPTTCEHCGKTDLVRHAINWANKSGKYKRDLLDWIRLCIICHRKHDKSLFIFREDRDMRPR